MADLDLTKPAARYADALFGLAKEKGVLDAVNTDVVALKSSLDADRTILRDLLDPKKSRAEKTAIAEKRLMPGRHRFVGNLIRVLLARRREGVLPYLFSAYAGTLERAQGILRISVETANPVGEGTISDLSRRLGETTGRPVAIEARVNPELLGGMRFLVDSQLIDGSIASRLNRLRTKLLGKTL